MQKKLIAILAAVAVLGVVIFQTVPAMAQVSGQLDHVAIEPSSVSLPTGGMRQFSAQGYDINNVTLTDVAYFWIVPASVGTINSTGFFTAGNTPGVYNNTIEVVAIKDGIPKANSANVTITSTVGILDHVVVTPDSVTLAPGQSQQFTAQAYDAHNVAISGLTYSWSVVSASGVINSTGYYTANSTLGFFPDTVQASTTQDSISRIGAADVTIALTPAPIPHFDISKLSRLFTSYLSNFGFGNLLGGQLQVKNGTGTDTIKVIPGVVKAVSANSLTVLPNGQGTNVTFTIPAEASIIPEGTQLAVNDQVMVITVNDQVRLIVRVPAPVVATESEHMPPGLGKQEEDRREGKEVPPGWSHGRKVGWSKNYLSAVEEDEGEEESD